MQIIIPMSGFGERFKEAGFLLPKPLIEVEGKPIIAHVIDMFPGESDFIFICNQKHLNNKSFNMRKILKFFCPSGKIIAVDPKKKLGPVNSVLQAIDSIDLTKPTIVNYCDFTCYWDWVKFKKFLLKNKSVGAIPAYKGFHPHSLGDTNYAYIKERNGVIYNIQEKKPFTANKLNEYASSGTYFFKSALLMKEAFEELISKNMSVNGEFYVSLAYKMLIRKKHTVNVYPLQHFMQWGTPEDLAEYNYWSDIFKGLIKTQRTGKIIKAGSIIIPMAGFGSRFIKAGYKVIKPLLFVSGRPMFSQAVNDLPLLRQYIFILRKGMQGERQINKRVSIDYPGKQLVVLDKKTNGQATTVYKALKFLKLNKIKVQEPIIIGACDNGSIYNKLMLDKLMKNKRIDVIVFAKKRHFHAMKNPNMYGWISSDGQKIKKVSVKKQFNTDKNNPIIVGTFIFKKEIDFLNSYERMIQRNHPINNEFYIDSMINDAIDLGLNCYLLEIDHLIPWGVPNDLKTFEYWQSCFHKWTGHPYKIELDKRIPVHKRSNLKNKYKATSPS